MWDIDVRGIAVDTRERLDPLIIDHSLNERPYEERKVNSFLLFIITGYHTIKIDPVPYPKILSSSIRVSLGYLEDHQKKMTGLSNKHVLGSIKNSLPLITYY